jgi:hypothetical protein
MNNYTHDKDEYDYVTYADKYFGDQTDNEMIYTPHPSQPVKVTEISEQDIFENFISQPGLEIINCEKEIDERREKITIINC